MRWTKEEKMKMVLDYKANSYIPTINECSKKTMQNTIIAWSKVYDLYGENGLVHRYRRWRFNDKINAVYRVLNGESYHEVAYSLGMSNKATILSWHRKYLEFGQNGLKLDKRGRPRKMGNKPTKPTKSKFQTNEVTDLKKRLEYLEAENAYLKKLAALVQQRKAQEQKKK